MLKLDGSPALVSAGAAALGRADAFQLPEPPAPAPDAEEAATPLIGRTADVKGLLDSAWLAAQFDDPRLAASARAKIARTMPNSPQPDDPEVKQAVEGARNLIRYEPMRLLAEGR